MERYFTGHISVKTVEWNRTMWSPNFGYALYPTKLAIGRGIAQSIKQHFWQKALILRCINPTMTWDDHNRGKTVVTDQLVTIRHTLEVVEDRVMEQLEREDGPTKQNC